MSYFARCQDTTPAWWKRPKSLLCLLHEAPQQRVCTLVRTPRCNGVWYAAERSGKRVVVVSPAVYGVSVLDHAVAKRTAVVGDSSQLA